MESNKQFVRTWFEEVWNKGREDAIDELMHPEARAYGLGPDPIVGPAGFKPFYQGFRSGFDNIHVSVDNTYTDGDTVIALCTVNANHRETNTPVCFTGTSITVVKDGQLTEGWNHFDFLTMNMQIGKITPAQLM